MQGVENELGFPSKNRFIPKDLRMHNNNSNNEGEEEKLLAVNGSNNINDGDVTLEVTPKVIYNECGTLRLWAKLGCREFKTQTRSEHVLQREFTHRRRPTTKRSRYNVFKNVCLNARRFCE